MRYICSILLLLACVSKANGQDDVAEQALLRVALCESNLTEGRAMLEAHLSEHPDSGDAIRFGIGMAHFFESGERLLRFWRMATWTNQQQGTGINLRRVFLEPQCFDLLLWIQGSAAKQYLEGGR